MTPDDLPTDDLSTDDLSTDDLPTDDLPTDDLSTDDLSTDDLSTTDRWFVQIRDPPRMSKPPQSEELSIRVARPSLFPLLPLPFTIPPPHTKKNPRTL